MVLRKKYNFEHIYLQPTFPPPRSPESVSLISEISAGGAGGWGARDVRGVV